MFMTANKNDKIQSETEPQIDSANDWLESKGVSLEDYMDAVRKTVC